MTPPAVDGVCDECGYDYDAPARGEIAQAIRGAIPEYRRRLVSTGVDKLRVRPEPSVWSPLEYACHMRDVFSAQRDRLRLALNEEEPTFTSMRREERVTEERYNEQDPRDVAEQFEETAEGFATELDALTASDWQRTGIYSYPSPRPRSVEWIARHTLHEALHHLMDIGRQLDP